MLTSKRPSTKGFYEMNPDDYQNDATQTESHPEELLRNQDQIDALDSLLKAAVRFGSAADKLKKHLFYGREVDLYKLIEVELNREEPDASVDTEELNTNRRKVRLIHAFLGLFSELEEIAEPLRKHLIHDEPLDLTNMMEEGGDKLWYLAIYFDALGFQMSEAMRRNISKLAKRYPDKKFTTTSANVRNLDVERIELEGGLQALEAHSDPTS